MNMNWRRSQTDPNYSVSPEVNDRVNLLFNQGLRGSQLSTGGYPDRKSTRLNSSHT